MVKAEGVFPAELQHIEKYPCQPYDDANLPDEIVGKVLDATSVKPGKVISDIPVETIPKKSRETPYIPKEQMPYVPNGFKPHKAIEAMPYQPNMTMHYEYDNEIAYEPTYPVVKDSAVAMKQAEQYLPGYEADLSEPPCGEKQVGFKDNNALSLNFGKLNIADTILYLLIIRQFFMRTYFLS
jgi:hypothetical protein